MDRIERIVGDLSCVGIKNVTVNEPHFQGQFPGNPVNAGVLIIEGMAQTAGVICILANGGIPKDQPAPLVYFMTIDEAKFRRPVVPGDVFGIPHVQAGQAAQHVVVSRGSTGFWRVGGRGACGRHDFRILMWL